MFLRLLTKRSERLNFSVFVQAWNVLLDKLSRFFIHSHGKCVLSSSMNTEPSLMLTCEEALQTTLNRILWKNKSWLKAGESVCGRHGCLGLIRCRQCHWLIHLQRVWSQVQWDHERCRRFVWLWLCTCDPVLGGNYIHSGNGRYRDSRLVCRVGRTWL